MSARKHKRLSLHKLYVHYLVAAASEIRSMNPTVAMKKTVNNKLGVVFMQRAAVY